MTAGENSGTEGDGTGDCDATGDSDADMVKRLVSASFRVIDQLRDEVKF